MHHRIGNIHVLQWDSPSRRMSSDQARSRSQPRSALRRTDQRSPSRVNSNLLTIRFADEQSNRKQQDTEMEKATQQVQSISESLE